MSGRKIARMKQQGEESTSAKRQEEKSDGKQVCISRGIK